MKETGNNAVKRSISAVMAFLMAAMLVLGLNQSFTVEAFAAQTTKKLTNGNITVELDKSCVATNVSVDIKTAEEGFHDFVDGPFVHNYLDYMYGNNGVSGVISLTDKDGNKVDYNGTLNVTYTLPDGWDVNYGIKTVTVSGAAIGDYKYYSGIVAESSLNLGSSSRTVTFSMDYSNSEEISEDTFDATRFVIMQNIHSDDIKELADGVYDVNIAMLSDVKSGSLSMAANTVDRNARVIVENGKTYLNIDFNMGVVLFMPAFANKVYSVDINSNDTSAPIYGSTYPGTVNTYYGNEEARNFSFTTMKNGFRGLTMSDAEIWAEIDETVLQNGIKAIHNVTLDVTNSIQEDGTILIGFCSDIMDSLYNGDYGSDAGYNTTNIMVANPVKSEASSSEYVKNNTGVDKTNLEQVFAQYINMSDTGMVFRNVYTEETYNTYYVPAWQKVFQAYTYVNATQEQIDEAVTEGKEALTKLVSKTVADNSSIIWNVKNLIKKVNKADETLYTSATYNALTEAVTEGQALIDAGNDVKLTDLAAAYNKINAAYVALALKATDYTALEAAINEAKTIDLTGYTEKTVKAFNEELKNAEAMLDLKDSSDEQIAEQIKALSSAKQALSTYDVIEDGIYKVNVSMVKTNRKDPSMAGGAINSIAKLEVVDGEYYLTLDFKGMTITNKFGYLSKLWYYEDGYTYDQYGEPTGKLVAAEVLSTQKNSDGSDVIDIYNDENNLYPDIVKIKLGTTALSDEDGYVPLRVMVPIMEAIAEGNGQHNVLMKIEWASLVKTTEDDADIQPEEPVEQSPEVNAVDETTNIKVHADKGVFGNGVKLSVTSVKSGSDYDKAVSVLENVAKKFNLFEIHFEDAEGVNVQPNGTVTVYYPIPADYNSENVALYRINEDGTKTLINGVVEDGYYKVVTKSFSTYALVQKVSTDNTDNNNTDNNQNTSDTGNNSQDTENAGTNIGSDNSNDVSDSNDAVTTESNTNTSDNSTVTDNSSVHTGDADNYMAWALIAAIAVITGAVTVIARKKNSDITICK